MGRLQIGLVAAAIVAAGRLWPRWNLYHRSHDAIRSTSRACTPQSTKGGSSRRRRWIESHWKTNTHSQGYPSQEYVVIQVPTLKTMEGWHSFFTTACLRAGSPPK